MIICFYREMYDVKVGRFSTFMRILEVLGVYMFFAGIIYCLHHYSFWMFDFELDSLIKFMGIDNERERALFYR